MAAISPLGAMAAEVTDLNDYAAVRYTNIAFVTFMVFDHAITFDTEVARIWTLQWRLPKVLFLINRYVAIRTFLIGLFICVMIAWVALSLVIMQEKTGSPGGFLFPGCLFSAPTYFFAAWIPAVVFESTIVLITLYYLSAYEWSTEINVTLRVLARDSVIYFLIIFSILVSNLFIARFGRDFLGSLLIAPSSVVACVGAARMMMNIRELDGERGPRTTTLHRNTMEFRGARSTTVGNVGTTVGNTDV
ncbi:hypothetical protein K438DRAFT_2022297 [Mycena galopus ATCC 62051]|nr:hypothetical protein K438DRAFT_2022297 [Mycena galopus ATCC 62051]